MSIIAKLKGMFKGEKEMKIILFIDGSLRKGSFNHQLAEEAEKAFAGKATVSYLDWAQVPVFSQDLEANAPESVVKVREAIQAADAFWIFSPIYNDLIPFIRTTSAGEFTKATVNPEAWGTGVLEISDETKASLAAQAEALLAAVSTEA